MNAADSFTLLSASVSLTFGDLYELTGSVVRANLFPLQVRFLIPEASTTTLSDTPGGTPV